MDMQFSPDEILDADEVDADLSKFIIRNKDKVDIPNMIGILLWNAIELALVSSPDGVDGSRFVKELFDDLLPRLIELIKDKNKGNP